MKAVNREFPATGWTTNVRGKVVYRHYGKGRRIVTKTLPPSMVALVKRAIANRKPVEQILAMLEDRQAIAS
ncbi:MAG TPA: hypothetical protein V6C63_14225 [Allocoleopsis sp.]